MDISERLRLTADDTDAVENASVAQLLEEAAALIDSLRREVREQRREIAALREERAALLAADRPKPDTL